MIADTLYIIDLDYRTDDYQAYAVQFDMLTETVNKWLNVIRVAIRYKEYCKFAARL